jgi:ribosome-binding factor A
MKPDRHTLQLCAQIAETLHLVLLDSKDDDLRELMVLEVLPIGGAGTLLARVSYPVQNLGDLSRVQQKLADSAKNLRSEIALAITRRRAPEILFQVVPSSSFSGSTK